MNRKMRAALANKKARETREVSPRPRHQVGRALFVDTNEVPLCEAPVHIDNEEMTIEVLPERSEMN